MTNIIRARGINGFDDDLPANSNSPTPVPLLMDGKQGSNLFCEAQRNKKITTAGCRGHQRTYKFHLNKNNSHAEKQYNPLITPGSKLTMHAQLTPGSDSMTALVFCLFCLSAGLITILLTVVLARLFPVRRLTEKTHCVLATRIVIGGYWFG